jgi:hypothetical protein
MKYPWQDNDDENVDALERLNVQRANTLIRNEVNNALQEFAFRYNTPDTRNGIVTRLVPIFETFVDERIIREYKILCNEENNGPNVIDAHRLNTRIYFNLPGIIGDRVLEVSMVAGEVNARADTLEKGKQIFCEIDPYGEENW